MRYDVEEANVHIHCRYVETFFLQQKEFAQSQDLILLEHFSHSHICWEIILVRCRQYRSFLKCIDKFLVNRQTHQERCNAEHVVNQCE